MCGGRKKIYCLEANLRHWRHYWCHQSQVHLIILCYTHPSW
jgi:hypothetical protein